MQKKLTKVKQPLISIIMPVYNTVGFLPAALSSLQAQTYRNWELIIGDDHSSDGSWQIARQAARTDHRLKIFRNRSNRGVSATANAAIKLAQSQYVVRMDSDDISAPERLALQLAYLQRHKKVVAVGGQCEVINDQGQLLGHKNFPIKPAKVAEMLFSFASIQQPAMMVNTNLLPANFQWYDEAASAAEEHDLLFRFLEHGQLANLPETVLQYRMHGANISSQHPKRDFWRIARARWQAVFQHHYIPTVGGVLTNLAQVGLVSILPENLLYSLYAKLRGWSKPTTSFKDITKKQPTTDIKLSSLSVFFPMYNEAANVARVIEQAQQVLPNVAKKYEIIIVNDGSQDATSGIAHLYAKQDKHIRVIDQLNSGYGGALQTGFKAAKYDWVFFSDGDLQFDLHELKLLIPATKKNKVVFGYRKHRADHWQRLALATLLKFWNRFFFQFPAHIQDIDCAFKLFHNSVIRHIFPLHSQGAMISSELILKLADAEYDIAQVGVTHYPRQFGQQTGAQFHVIKGAIIETIRLVRMRQFQPFVKMVQTSAPATIATAVLIFLYTQLQAKS